MDLPRPLILTTQIYHESGHEYWLPADQEVETIIHSTGTVGDLTGRSYGAKDRDTGAEIHRQVNRRIADRAADAVLPLRMSVGAASHGCSLDRALDGLTVTGVLSDEVQLRRAIAVFDK